MSRASGVEERHIQGFGGETLGKETTWEFRPKLEVIIKMNLQEVGCGCTVWIELVHNRDR